MMVWIIEGADRQLHAAQFEKVLRARYEMVLCQAHLPVVWERKPQEKAA